MHFSLSENSFVMQTQCVVEKLEHCLRQQLRMVNVYSHVRKNYKSAELLMLSATKAYFCCLYAVGRFRGVGWYLSEHHTSQRNQ